MKVTFYKYHGTGNDFILIDNRKGELSLTTSQIEGLCDRHFGIGADGLMLLNTSGEADFEMVYYNSDGKTSSMCGNGGRCIAAFAKSLKLVGDEASFVAIDGKHDVKYSDGKVSLRMNNVSQIEKGEGFYFLDTGSPHYVKVVNDLHDINLVAEARKVRYNERFKTEGTNVNFIQQINGKVHVRTYERGVEDETLSCGTGVTAVALVADQLGWRAATNNCLVSTEGGDLTVIYDKHDGGYNNIWLIGPAKFVFKGEVEI